jgi:hypothetical protein
LGAIEYGYVAATVMDQSRLLQHSSGFGDGFAAHAKHIGDHFLRHRQFARRHSVQALCLRTILQVFDDSVTRASGRFKTLPIQNSDVATTVID